MVHEDKSNFRDIPPTLSASCRVHRKDYCQPLQSDYVFMTYLINIHNGSIIQNVYALYQVTNYIEKLIESYWA